MAENIKKKDFGVAGLMLRGLAMGLAEVIPGVSGGTIAFITGIYERLINVISGLSPSLINVLFKEGFGSFWQKLDGNFLAQLLIGMAGGIVVGVFGVTYLLEQTPTVLWAFFFGLIAASVIYMLRQTNRSKILTWVLFVISTIAAYLIVSISPLNGSTAYIYVFLSGAIAICALILPGISGSFILLILGMYTVIVPQLKSLLTDFSMASFKLVFVFGLGCLTGLLTFSKVLKFTFENYRNATLSVLSGLMLGSLVKIWPWRNPITVVDKATGDQVPIAVYTKDLFNDQYKLISEQNVMPEQYFSDPMTSISLLSMVLGFGLVIGAMLYQRDGAGTHN